MTPIDLISMLTLAALWGASFLFMRIAAPVLGPIWLIEGRVLLTALVLLPWVVRLGFWPQLRANLLPLLFLGCINSAIPFCLLSFTTVVLPAGVTSILNATIPLFGVVVAFFWIKEPLSRSRLIGLGLGFVGVVVLMGLQPVPPSGQVGLAVAAALAAALLYAIAAPYIRRDFAQVNPLVITTGSQIGAALLLLPLLPYSQPQTAPSLAVLLAVVGLAVLSTACAYLLYFRLIAAIGATRTLTVGYLIPAFAMVWGALLLGEAITAAMVAGCGLILLGTAVANDLVFRPQ